MSGGGLRKQQTKFVKIPRDTIRDRRLSFRARGLLAYLLDMPDGWDVRSEALAHEGAEGREAIRTAMHELGRYGYYRLERRRMLDGTVVMGTAISEAPVLDWAREYEEHEGRAVRVVEQEDRSFLSAPVQDTSPAPEVVPAQDVLAIETEDGFPGAGAGARKPDAGSPGAGSPGAGFPGASRKTVTEDSYVPPPGGPRGTRNLRRGRQRADPDADPLDVGANRVASTWWESLPARPAQSFTAVRGIVRTALANGIPAPLIEAALGQMGRERRAITAASLDVAITDCARHSNAPPEFRAWAGQQQPRAAAASGGIREINRHFQTPGATFDMPS